MSLISRPDVKNRLSANHRTEIHLACLQSQSDATGFAHEEVAVEDPKVSDPVEKPVITPTPNKPETAPIVICKSAKA
jgi:hypothetical protein